MNLKALQGVDTAVAQVALANLTKNYLPWPLEQEALPEDEVTLDAKAELDSLFTGSGSPGSKGHNQEVLNFLYRQMASLAIPKGSTEQIKERLGSKGDLPSDQYKIEFGSTAKEFGKRGVSRKEVIQAIRRPDSVTHLLRGEKKIEGASPISIYLKQSKWRGNQIFLIVQTKREGAVLQISTAWKVLSNDLHLGSPFNALEALQAFVEIFGLDFSIGSGTPHRFLLYDAIPILRETTELLHVLTLDKVSFVTSFMFRMSPVNVAEISIAYVINTTKYMEYLKRHEIKAIK